MRNLLSYWTFSFSSAVLATLLLIYVSTVGIRGKRALPLIFVLFTTCFFSPLNVLSTHYLFSAHMIVHVILLLVIGPLLVASESQKPNKFATSFYFLKNHPMLAWLTGVCMMWVWHIPWVFNETMAYMHRSPFLLSVLEPMMLVFAGIVFSSPIINSRKEYRIDALSGVVYLFTACIACSLLGLLITFAPTGTYHHFLSMHDNYGLDKIILQNGITQSIDQQAAGLIMWVPCCLVYVTGAMYLLAKWFNQKEEAVLTK
ncbi:MAG TPA: cytochrome c oxidase assembly protein [Flavisolibacter sp.]